MDRMKMKDEERDDYLHVQTLEREKRKQDRLEAKVEAFKEMLKNELSTFAKSEDAKNAMAKEIDSAVSSNRYDEFMKKAGEGTYRGYHDREVIDGYERPWERD